MEADYTDTYATTVRNARRMTAPDLFHLMFVRYPKPVQYLLRLRDWLVKPFGLQAGGGFTDLIQEQNEENVVFGKQDKHLAFEVRLTCPPPDTYKQSQLIQITTSVQFHNTLGRVYFFFIRPFHHLICRSLLKRAARRWEKNNLKESIKSESNETSRTFNI
ncbi:DUF2867 domain-containing protein [uncultured Mediterranea sp.]|uniref:DUF2867 domain-containing protein n=1 Tax=uncultured Mediterranea sp. TaxID=1926662 RepID=UPI0027D973EC|nr:DUF2867 domain-containing protein [uncultured Mediterranea sp.]